MVHGGIIVRLIDVVLILLFGFISISEISRKSKIELPQSTQTPPSNPDMESVLIIGITQDGKFLVDNEKNLIAGFDDLKDYIWENTKYDILNNNRARIRIRANWNTPLKHIITLVHLCDELDFAKSIDVIRKVQQ